MSPPKKTFKFTRRVENLIAELRNLPTDKSRLRDRGSKPISDLLDTCLKKYKIGQLRPEDIIMSNWKDIVGSKNAHRSCPQAILSGGVLAIKANNAVIRSEMSFQKQAILAKVRQYPECASIKSIILRA